MRPLYINVPIWSNTKCDNKVICLDDSKKGRPHSLISDLSAGLKELIALPLEKKEAPILLSAHETRPQRPKTPKEQELDSLISARQSIIEQLKAKNPLVLGARRLLSELVPAIRGKGASRVMELVREEEKIEFSIATEAYTPKKEKELLKRLREIHIELSRHKELDAARKKVDGQRAVLRSLVSDIKSLERQLDGARAACDAKYAEVLAERKAGYEQRQKSRELRKERQFQELRERVHSEKKREYDSEMSKYMKDYDDTVSMNEICVFEKKEKKKGE